MNFGERLRLLRKEKGLSRDDLAVIVGTSGPIIGRYERNEITPSVEVALKIADALEVTLDYLVGATATLTRDKNMQYRLELIDKLEKKDKDRLLYVVDALLRDAQLQTTQQHLTR